ncbi:GON-4-like protein isoform X2 [Rana temporaria]|uniref:GON-4-like protein isoform X2 n=1 Tax=Rana temporaria TaxID=8407 RepID=UPI001AAC8108|nr:GON-4-like protein isoform X2 [Rana temporaria]
MERSPGIKCRMSSRSEVPTSQHKPARYRNASASSSGPLPASHRAPPPLAGNVSGGKHVLITEVLKPPEPPIPLQRTPQTVPGAPHTQPGRDLPPLSGGPGTGPLVTMQRQSRPNPLATRKEISPPVNKKSLRTEPPGGHNLSECDSSDCPHRPSTPQPSDETLRVQNGGEQKLPRGDDATSPSIQTPLRTEADQPRPQTQSSLIRPIMGCSPTSVQRRNNTDSSSTSTSQSTATTKSSPNDPNPLRPAAKSSPTDPNPLRPAAKTDISQCRLITTTSPTTVSGQSGPTAQSAHITDSVPLRPTTRSPPRTDSVQLRPTTRSPPRTDSTQLRPTTRSPPRTDSVQLRPTTRSPPRTDSIQLRPTTRSPPRTDSTQLRPTTRSPPRTDSAQLRPTTRSPRTDSAQLRPTTRSPPRTDFAQLRPTTRSPPRTDSAQLRPTTRSPLRTDSAQLRPTTRSPLRTDSTQLRPTTRSPPRTAFAQLRPTTRSPPRTDSAQLRPTTRSPPRTDSAQLRPTTRSPSRTDSAQLKPTTGSPPRTAFAQLRPTTRSPPRTNSAQLKPTTRSPPRTDSIQPKPTTRSPPRTDSIQLKPTTRSPQRSTKSQKGGRRSVKRQNEAPQPSPVTDSAVRVCDQSNEDSLGGKPSTHSKVSPGDSQQQSVAKHEKTPNRLDGDCASPCSNSTPRKSHLPEEEDGEEGSGLFIPVDEEESSDERKKRKRLPGKKRRENRPEDDAPPVSSDQDQDLERALEDGAKQHNLTVVNVRNILHEVITNEHVVAMMKAAINETEGLPLFEPKMTRSKLKEVVEKGVVIPTWNLSPIKKANKVQAPQFVDIALEEEDSSDEEYQPDEEEEDEESLLESDVESTASSPRGHKRLRAQNLSESQEEEAAEGQNASLSSARHICFESVPMGPPPPPKVKHAPDFAFMEKLHAVDEELERHLVSIDSFQTLDESLIAFRTRSKRPLKDVPMGRLEAELHAPDITPDMYDLSTADDEYWKVWLRSLMQDDVGNEDEGDDDEDDDPEYNILEDWDEPDTEDLRNDRAVRITKKEVNELMEELFETFQDEMGISHLEDEGPDDDSSSDPFPDFNTPQAMRFEEPLANLLTEQHRTVRAQLEFLRMRKSMMKSDDDKSVRDPDIPKPPSPRAPPVLTLDVMQRKRLQQQMQQHIQLLTQLHLLTFRNPGLSVEAETAQMYLVELSSFAESSSLSHQQTPGFQSAFHPCNLREALQLIPLVHSQVPEDPESPIPARKNGNEVSDLPKHMAWVIATRPVFMYPELLPVCSMRARGPRDRTFFTKAEDSLLALGLKHFEGTEFSKQLISKFLLTAKTAQQLTVRIKNLTMKKSPDNVIKYYKKNKMLPPLSRCCEDILPQNMRPPVEREKLKLPFWIKASLSSIEAYMKNTESRNSGYPLLLPPAVAMTLKPLSRRFYRKLWRQKRSALKPLLIRPPAGTTCAPKLLAKPAPPQTVPIRIISQVPPFMQPAVPIQGIVNIQPVGVPLGRKGPEICTPISNKRTVCAKPAGASVTHISVPQTRMIMPTTANQRIRRSLLGGIPKIKTVPRMVGIKAAPLVHSGPVLLAVPNGMLKLVSLGTPCRVLQPITTVVLNPTHMPLSQSLITPPYKQVQKTVCLGSGVGGGHTSPTLEADESIKKAEDDLMFEMKDEDDLVVEMEAEDHLVVEMEDDLVVEMKDDLVVEMKAKDDLVVEMKAKDDLVVEMKAEDDLVVEMKAEDDLVVEMKAKDDLVVEMKAKDDLVVEMKAEDDLVVEMKAKDNLVVEMKDEDNLVVETKAEDDPECAAEGSPDGEQNQDGGESDGAGEPSEDKPPKESERSSDISDHVTENDDKSTVNPQSSPSAGGAPCTSGGGQSHSGEGQNSEVSLKEDRDLKQEDMEEPEDGNEPQKQESGGGAADSPKNTSPSTDGDVEISSPSSAPREFCSPPPGGQDLTIDKDGAEEEEEEDFDDLTQDEDEMSSASEESVLSVPELQETMEKLTWLASERRLSQEADSEENSQEENTEEEEEEDVAEVSLHKAEEMTDETGEEGEKLDASHLRVPSPAPVETNVAPAERRRAGSKGPSAHRVRNRRGRTRASKDSSKLLLLYDEKILLKDPLREQKDMAYARSYLNRVREALQPIPGTYEQFLNIIYEYEMRSSKRTAVDLFERLQHLLQDWPQLLKDFAAFLLPEQALECGLFEEQQAFEKSRRFLRQLEICFKENPAHHQKIIKLLQSCAECPLQEIGKLKTQMFQLLKGHHHLQEEFSLFFDQLRPPASRMEDFEVMNWTEEKEYKFDGFEEVTLPEVEEEEEPNKVPPTQRNKRRKEASQSQDKDVDWLEGGKDCPCSCHDGGAEQRLKRCKRRLCGPCSSKACDNRSQRSADAFRQSSAGDGKSLLKSSGEERTGTAHRSRSTLHGRGITEGTSKPRTQAKDSGRSALRGPRKPLASKDPPPAPIEKESERSPQSHSGPCTPAEGATRCPTPTASLCEPIPTAENSALQPAADQEEQTLTVCAKNIRLSSSGEKVIVWTREADRVILTMCQERGAHDQTFGAVSEQLGNKSPSEVAQRFRELISLFQTGCVTSSDEEEEEEDAVVLEENVSDPEAAQSEED